VTSRLQPEDAQASPELKQPDLPKGSLDAAQPVPDHFINVELSWLEFNARVVALAEDPGTPLLARLQFLSIFSSNLDEFFMVRIGGLKHAVAEGISDTSPDGLTPQEQLDAVSVRLAPLIERQQRCFHKVCLPDLERRGIRLLRWRDLDEGQQEEMRKYFDEQIFPVLTPQALTHAPGHPFPHLANLSLSLALMVKDPKGGPTHFAHIRVPGGLPRFVQLSSGQEFVTIEEVIGANLQPLYPGRLVEEVHPFRITRSGDIQVDEEGATNLMRAIEDEVQRRPFGSVVRIQTSSSPKASSTWGRWASSRPSPYPNSITRSSKVGSPSIQAGRSLTCSGSATSWCIIRTTPLRRRCSGSSLRGQTIPT
jgi:polyphosphate kinase